MNKNYLSKREQITRELNRIIDSERESFDYKQLRGEIMFRLSVSENMIDSVFEACESSGRIEINKKENIIINIKAREIKKRNINNEINEVFGENGTETKT